jgi:hypothetical protein
MEFALGHDEDRHHRRGFIADVTASGLARVAATSLQRFNDRAVRADRRRFVASSTTRRARVAAGRGEGLGEPALDGPDEVVHLNLWTPGELGPGVRSHERVPQLRAACFQAQPGAGRLVLGRTVIGNPTGGCVAGSFPADTLGMVA